MSPGASRAIVLVHGWRCDHSYMAPQASHFAGRGHLVVSLDLRGHGRSGRPHQTYPIGGFGDDVAGLCGALNLAKPILIGHSIGGIVAFDIAARYPDLPGAIVMLDSAIVLPEATRTAIPAFLERLRGPDYVAALHAYVKERLLLPTDDAVRSAAILKGMGEATQFVAAASFGASVVSRDAVMLLLLCLCRIATGAAVCAGFGHSACADFAAQHCRL